MLLVFEIFTKDCFFIVSLIMLVLALKLSSYFIESFHFMACPVILATTAVNLFLVL